MPQANQPPAIDYAGRRIEYAVRRSLRRRTIGLSVQPDGSVQVAAPRWADAAQIAAYVREKAAWVLKHQLRMASLHAARPVRPERAFAEGEALPLLGEPLTLRYVEAAKHSPPHAWREDGALLLAGLPSSHADEASRREAVRRVLTGWYRAQAQSWFTATAQGYCAQLGLAAPRVAIGDASRRWGSCSAKGGLRFCWRLLLGPRETAEYLVVHEVAHLVELNHSDRFWAVVAGLMPDYKKHERRLTELAETLHL